MAAVLAPAPSPRPLRPARRPGDAPGRPDLRVIPGGRPARPLAPRYRRRRVVAALALVAVVALAVVGGRALVSALDLPTGASAGSGPGAGAPSSAPVPAASPTPGATYVVQPGDTLWGIAHQLQPEGDVRELVDRLADQVGGSSLRVGQRLDLGQLLG